MAVVTINLLNLWSEFSRAYFLACALRAYRTGGGRIEHDHDEVQGVESALALAIRKAGKRARLPPFTRFDEPAWHDVNRFLQVMGELRPSNLEQVNAAVSQPVVFFRELPTIRNFFAHRCHETADKVRRIATSHALDSRTHPTDLLVMRSPRRPQSLLADLIDEVRLVIEAM